MLAGGEKTVHVDDVGLSEANVTLATGTAASASRVGLASRVDFHAEAEAVPLPDGCAATVVCECDLCTFPDKATTMAEMAGLLAPGGRLGLVALTPKIRLGHSVARLCNRNGRPAASGSPVDAVEQPVCRGVACASEHSPQLGGLSRWPNAVGVCRGDLNGVAVGSSLPRRSPIRPGRQRWLNAARP